MANTDLSRIKFRENWTTRCVDVKLDGTTVFSNAEYRGAAIWAQSRFNLSDSELMQLYQDYKEDYDADS